MLSIILLLAMASCMKPKSVSSEMVAYMNEKYDDHFEYVAPFGGHVGAITTQIIVASERFPDAQVWVEHYTKDGKDFFADNYVDYKYEEQTHEALLELLENVFECEVKLGFGVASKGTQNSFTNETTFEEYFTSAESYIGFNAVVSCDYMPESESDIEQKLLSAFADTGLIAGGSIYFSQSEETFQLLSNLSSSQRRMLKCMSFYMTTPTRFDSCEWR